MGRLINLTDKRFGRLLVYGHRTNKNQKTFWLCKCDCGKEKWVEGQPLRFGLTKSCGCLKLELLSKRTLKNISGQRFGRLLVLNQHKIRGTSGVWLCRCDCGNEKWIRPNALKSGIVKSCGCFGNEMRRKGSLEKKKKYKVILTAEQRQELESKIKDSALPLEEKLKSQILLLADQSSNAPSQTDKEIAKNLSITTDKAYYARVIFADPEFITRAKQRSRQMLLDPRTRQLRHQTQRRYESKPETKARIQKYRLKRFRTDLNFRLRVRLSKRLRGAIKVMGAKKTTSIVNLIGCSFQELVRFLENKFKLGMTWDNYGSWHIDHIVPCSRFDLTLIENQKKCFHYSNLQPLWAAENIAKSNKLIPVSI
jgi:hypothetical protein